MAKSTTTRLGLQRWTDDADTQDRSEFDGAHAQLEDLAAGYLRDVIASRPAAAAGNEGFWFEATDEAGALYWSTGTSWLGPFALVSDLDAAEVVFDPSGLEVVTGTDVQAAIEELDAAAASGSSVAAANLGPSESTTSTSYGDLATVGPAVTIELPSARDVLVILTAQDSHDTVNGEVYMDFAISGATTRSATDLTALTRRATTAGAFRRASVPTLVSLAAGTSTITAKFRVGGTAGTGSWQRRHLQVLIP